MLEGGKSADTVKLEKVLNTKIEKVINDGSGNLKIFFSNNTVLTLFDSNGNTESYSISMDGQEIIV